MLLRLSKLDSGLPRATLLLCLLLAFGFFAACGGERFSAAPADSDTSGSAGSGASAGDGVSLGDGGSGNDTSIGGGPDLAGAGGVLASAGSAGSAGKGAGGCANCDASQGMYCQDGTSKCHSCKDFSRLEFAAPQRLSTLSHSDTSSERFPRSAGGGSALFYAEDTAKRRELWYTAAPTSGIGSALSTTTVKALGSGPLLAPDFVKDVNFFFDGQLAAVTTSKIYMANWAAGALSEPVLAPAPLNVDGSDDYSIAIAPDAGHAYWMSTRAGMPQLFWESINETPMQEPSPLALKIRIGSNDGCERLGDDATPWVNLDGTVLLFSAESMSDTCEQNDSHAHDLFAVPLSDAGEPTLAAVPLSSLNVTGGGSDETDPSLSPDACSIYFASDSGTGNYGLYRATRN